MPQYNLRERSRQNIVEKLDLETLKGGYFFQDAYNMDVYFDDFDDKSADYLRLDYDPSFSLHAGRNLISIRGNSDTMEVGTELIIEAVDSQGDVIRTQIFDLNNDSHERVISIEISPQTPAGDVIFTIVGSARVAPDGTAIPQQYRGQPNFKWTRVFTAKPDRPNRSPITYAADSLPQIEIEEISKPFYKLHFNQELSSSIGWEGNNTASYTLRTGHNTNCSMSYQKNGGKFYVTVTDDIGGGILDFGGFTKDMEGGILIIREPNTPRPSSINGYDAPPVYAEDEIGDGLWEDTDGDADLEFTPGAYMTTILEVISPFNARTSEPHTTFQGTTATTYQEFEHFEFATSSFELIWSQMPQSYSADPTGSQGEEIRNSYAKVKFDNLEPLTGDVTRIKCYMKNHQAPFDWVLASDNAVETQELLYRKDATAHKHRMPVGDMSQWGVGRSTASLETYWFTEGVGTPAPSMSIYTQGGSGENPPVEDNLMIGTNQQALGLDGTAVWWLKCKESASFYEDQFYELSFKAVSVKATTPTWTNFSGQLGGTQGGILDPKIKIYLTGSAFTDGTDSLGKYIGKIEDIAVRKKHILLDEHDNKKEIGHKFIFKADGTEHGKPAFKIESGIWHLWDISIKPWDRKGYTPGTWDVIFPTIKANVGNPDALDFKFEFYNDYSEISNYTAVINKVPWVNEYTTVFTHIHTNLLNITETASFNGTVEFSGSFGIFTASDGLMPLVNTGSSPTYNSGTFYTMSTKDTFIITGSGGISTSLFTMSSDDKTKILRIDGSGAGGGSGMMTQWYVSPGSGVNAIGPDQTMSIVGGTGINTAFNASNNTMTITNTSLDTWRPNTSFSLIDDNEAERWITSHSFLHFSTNTPNNMQISWGGGTGVTGSPYTLSFDSYTYLGAGGGLSTWSYDPSTETGGGPTMTPIPGYELCNYSQNAMPKGGTHIGWPNTIGPDLFRISIPSLSAEYQNNYAEKTWLQVNNWSGVQYVDKGDVAYAAIFNTTGVPVATQEGPTEEMCCDIMNAAGHGIKIMTSTIPVPVDYKVKTKGQFGYSYNVSNTCADTGTKFPGPFVGETYIPPVAADFISNTGDTAGTQGLANAYYITFYHYSTDCGNTDIGSVNGIPIFAGGIRKDCSNPYNAIIIEYASDARLKTEIEDTKWGINDLMDIKVRDYSWKRTSNDPDAMKHCGFIAQELQEVFPLAAFGDEYGDINEEPMTVAPDRLIPLAIKSIQDQQKTIEMLMKRIEKLEKR